LKHKKLGPFREQDAQVVSHLHPSSMRPNAVA
jgi:hypothetical protein